MARKKNHFFNALRKYFFVCIATSRTNEWKKRQQRNGFAFQKKRKKELAFGGVKYSVTIILCFQFSWWNAFRLVVIVRFMYLRVNLAQIFALSVKRSVYDSIFWRSWKVFFFSLSSDEIFKTPKIWENFFFLLIMLVYHVVVSIWDN